MSALPAQPPFAARSTALLGASLVLLALGCAPLVRPATFAGARDQVTDATLIGPFDGQVVDVATNEPIAEALVVGVWSYDRGDGFIGPYGSETYSTTTDQAGRYRIPPAKLSVRGSTVRLVDFHLVVYKRGYAGYRSDALLTGGPRPDFTVRHNKIELRKWQESDSHADHLLFLGAARPLQKALRWEADLANVDLYRALGGAGAPAPEGAADQGPKAAARELLDASGLLTPDEIRQRTGYVEAFAIKDLPDLQRTDFYHGVHFQAEGGEERHDVAIRVWKAPPGGMDPVVATIQETFANVKPTGDITAETWLLSEQGVHAVALVDREQKLGLLLTCGDLQCADLDTAIILTKFAYRNADRLKTIAVEAEVIAGTGPGGQAPAGPGGQPGARGPLAPSSGQPPGTGPRGQTTPGQTAPTGGAGPSGQPAPSGTTSPKGQATGGATSPKGQATGGATSPTGQPSGGATSPKGQTAPTGGATSPNGGATSPKGQPPTGGATQPGAAGSRRGAP